MVDTGFYVADQTGAILGVARCLFLSADDARSLRQPPFTPFAKPHPKGADGTVWLGRGVWSKPDQEVIPGDRPGNEVKRK